MSGSMAAAMAAIAAAVANFTRTSVQTFNFDADADGAFPAGMDDLNNSNGQIQTENPTTTAGQFHNPYGNIADARANGTYSNDQYMKLRVQGLSAGNAADVIGGGCRYGAGTVGGAGVTGYRMKITDGGVGGRTILLSKIVNGGTDTALGAAVNQALVNGDDVWMHCTGAGPVTLAVYINSAITPLFTRTDSTSVITTGKPGILGTLGGNGTVRGDLVEAGNIT